MRSTSRRSSTPPPEWAGIGRGPLCRTGDERRHSLGLRAHGELAGWFWDWEAAYQTGRFAGGDIAAWTFATKPGYRWQAAAWRRR